MTTDPESPDGILLRACWRGDLKRVRQALDDGADVDLVPEDTGLGALHLAIGRDHIDVVKFLVREAGASLQPDRFGRQPTIIAAQCRASETLCDFILELEEHAASLVPGDDHT